MSSSKEKSMYVLIIALGLTEWLSSSPDNKTNASAPKVDTVAAGIDAEVRCLGADAHKLSMMICVADRSTAAAILNQVRFERVLFSACFRRNHILGGIDSKRTTDGAACRRICSNSNVKSKSRQPWIRGPKTSSAPGIHSMAGRP
jgi:hypothetical protein